MKKNGLLCTFIVLFLWTSFLADFGSQRPTSARLQIESRLACRQHTSSCSDKHAVSTPSVREAAQKKARNQERLKEVEQQQTEFGVGIND